jgi:hypothetical protein
MDYLTRRLSPLSDFGISLSLCEAPRAIEQIDPHPPPGRPTFLAREARAGAERGRQKQ